MANEIQLNTSVQVANGNMKFTIAPGTINVDQTTAIAHAPVVIINTSAAETISFGDITTVGWLFMRSLETATTGNYVTYGPDSTGMIPFGKLKPNELHSLRLSSTGITLKAQANTAAVKVQFWILSD